MSKGKARILCLLEIFKEKTDADHRLGVPELVAELQERGVVAERKSIYRDIDVLMESGVDVRRSSTGYYLGERDFSLPEMRLLLSAVQAASFISEPRTRELTDKLCSLLSQPQAELLRGQLYIGGSKCGGDEVFRTIEAVSLAIAAGRQIRFFYTKRDVSKKSVIQHSGRYYHASPYAMIWMQDRYYLVCNLRQRDNLTHFRLDRMQGVEQEKAQARPFQEVSEYVSFFDAQDYAAKCLNMYGGPVLRIVLRCQNEMASEVLDRFGVDTLVRREDAEHFTAYVQAAGGLGFLGWASQFGPSLEIVSPPELREAMKERMREAAALYAE